jgi:probable rRNA maturation factor
VSGRAADSDAGAIVDVQIESTAAGIPTVSELVEWIRRAIRLAAPDRALEVTLRVTDKAEIQQLNREYRQHDRPTNVLSFPADLPEGPWLEAMNDNPVTGTGHKLLGDIVVCAEVLAEEATEQGKRIGDHWAHMLVHGCLHLLGYDHEEESDAARMEALEARILGAYGIADPYWVD